MRQIVFALLLATLFGLTPAVSRAHPDFIVAQCQRHDGRFTYEACEQCGYARENSSCEHSPTQFHCTRNDTSDGYPIPEMCNYTKSGRPVILRCEATPVGSSQALNPKEQVEAIVLLALLMAVALLRRRHRS